MENDESRRTRIAPNRSYCAGRRASSQAARCALAHHPGREGIRQAFRRFALEGHKAREVAQKLNITPNAVFIAKSRVLSRLRQEAEGLVESSSDFLAKS